MQQPARQEKREDSDAMRTPLMVRERSLLRVTPPPPSKFCTPHRATSAVLTWGLEGDAPLGGLVKSAAKSMDERGHWLRSDASLR